MEPMKPMKPMEPMKPMKPMEPMGEGERWWPEGLGSPSSSGAQDGMRYAFFPDARRLAVETEGTTTLYDSGDHRIGGVAQSGGGSARFTDADGTVPLSDLKKVG